MPLLVLLALSCADPTPPPPPPPRTVVLVSMDTTRADALSSYAEQSHWGLTFPPDSRPTPATPVIDGLAQSGVRFAWALAHSPTTLSSHTSLLSGRDSHRHRVPRNGYPVPTDIPLLQGHLQSAGWDTVAVLGSSALEQKMGLDRGFTVYNDPGPQPPGGMYMLPAEEVTTRALAEVDAHIADPARQSADLFLFVHYYDAHMPWFTAPADVVQRFTRPDYAGPIDGGMPSIGLLTKARIAGKLTYGDARQARGLYLAQVAHTDAQIGVLLDGLAARGLDDDRLVIVTSDHGEVLDEDAKHPYTHGPSTALEALHVPLVMQGSGRLAVPGGVVVERSVRLQDVATTILGVIGDSTIMGDGEDLGSLWRGSTAPMPPSFAEASRPMNLEQRHKWNNANLERSVFLDGQALRYRPGEGGLATLHALAPGSPRLAEVTRIRELAALIHQWDAAAPEWVAASYDDETARALQALGYLDDDSVQFKASPPTASPPSPPPSKSAQSVDPGPE